VLQSVLIEANPWAGSRRHSITIEWPMTKPWLSVIVPSHNGERWLGAALHSLVDQREQGIEVIVIDTSNTDVSLRIAEGFSDELNIHTERRPDLLGWELKVNYGVSVARGDRISILHQDDLWLPGRCAELRKWLSCERDAVMHLHPSYIIDEAGRRLGVWRCPLSDGRSPQDVLLERLLVQNFISIPAPIIGRDAYLSVGGLDEKLWYTQDWDLYLKLAAFGNVYYHSTPLTCFRIHKNSLTMSGSRDKSDFRRQHEIVVDRHIKKVAGSYQAEVARLAQTSIDVNTALAAAVGGEVNQVFVALTSVLRLGPRGMTRYFHHSRIVDRVLPRLRALVTRRF
jgi:glycosyltransferase involved in cell wall biosynthesis